MKKMKGNHLLLTQLPRTPLILLFRILLSVLFHLFLPIRKFIFHNPPPLPHHHHHFLPIIAIIILLNPLHGLDHPSMRFFPNTVSLLPSMTRLRLAKSLIRSSYYANMDLLRLHRVSMQSIDWGSGGSCCLNRK